MRAIHAVLLAGATLMVLAAIQTPAAAQTVTVYVWPAQASNPAVSSYYQRTPASPNGGFAGTGVPGTGPGVMSLHGPNLGGVHVVGASFSGAGAPAVQVTCPTQFVPQS
jgi:hypothetical protein